MKKNNITPKSFLVKKAIELYKSTLNPASKWFADDVASFSAIASKKTIEELLQQNANMRAITGQDKKVNTIVNTELKKMDRGGMFNVGNMKPANALD